MSSLISVDEGPARLKQEIEAQPISEPVAVQDLPAQGNQLESPLINKLFHNHEITETNQLNQDTNQQQWSDLYTKEKEKKLETNQPNNNNNNDINLHNNKNTDSNEINKIDNNHIHDDHDHDDHDGPISDNDNIKPNHEDDNRVEQNSMQQLDGKYSTDGQFVTPSNTRVEHESLLPAGWEKVVDPIHGTFYIDHNTKRTQYERPYGIELCKSCMGFGFTLVEADNGLLLVRSIIPGGPAHCNGQIKPGDILLSAVDISVSGMQHTDVAKLFSQFAVGDRVKLVFARSNYVLDADLIPDEYLFSNGPDGDMAFALNPAHPNPYQDQYPIVLTNPNDHNPDMTVQHLENNQDLYDLMRIVLRKGEQGFGFTLGHSPFGQRIKDVQNNESCMDLKQGDILVRIDDLDVLQMQHNEVISYLKNCPINELITITIMRKKRFRSKTPMTMYTSQTNPMSNYAPIQRNCLTPSFDGMIRDNELSQPRSLCSIQDGGPALVNYSPEHEANYGYLPIMPNNQSHLINNNPFIQSATIDQQVVPLVSSNGESIYSNQRVPDYLAHSDLQNHEPQMISYDQSNHSNSSNIAFSASNPTINNGRDSNCNNPNAQDNQQTTSDNNSISKNDGSLKDNDDRERSNIQNRGPISHGSVQQKQHKQQQQNWIEPKTHQDLNQLNQYNNFMHNDRLMMMHMQQQQPIYKQLVSNPNDNYLDTSSMTQQVNHMRHQRDPLYSNQEMIPMAQRLQPFPAYPPEPIYGSYLDFQMQPNNNNYYANNEEIALQRFQDNQIHQRLLNSQQENHHFPFMPRDNDKYAMLPNINAMNYMNSNIHQMQSMNIPMSSIPMHNVPASSMNGFSNGNSEEFEFHLIDLDRESTQSNWGIRLIGGAEVNRAISIGSVVFGGAAAKNGKLKSGDEIISINGIKVLGATHQHVVELISACANRASIMIRRKKFAEACDVVLTRSLDEGFGFVIISSGDCALIGKIIEGSPADRCQQLHVRDRIIAVGGRDITPNMQHPEIVNMIKESGSVLRLRIIPADCYSVELIKNSPGDSFGFRMRGGSEFDGCGLYILKVAANGLARDLLNVGDQIIEINGIPTVGMTHQQAASIIKHSDPIVKLKLRRNYITPPSLLVDSPRELQKYNQVTAEVKSISNQPISSPSTINQQQAMNSSMQTVISGVANLGLVGPNESATPEYAGQQQLSSVDTGTNNLDGTLTGRDPQVDHANELRRSNGTPLYAS